MTADTENIEDLSIPVTPRFTLESLREIFIPEGGAGTTLARYTFINAARRVVKRARIEDLTEEERHAALAFILEHTAGVKVKRSTPIKPIEPIDLESLTIPEELLTEGGEIRAESTEDEAPAPLVNGTTPPKS